MLISIAAQAQRIKPSSRIEKASDSTYILLSDVDGKYQHTKLVAESGISFTISNDTIKIGALSTLDGSGQSLRITSWLDANTLQATNIFYNGQEIRFSDLTNSMTFPTGTTLERDVFPDNGQARYNTDNNEFEFYENGSWVTLGSGGGSGVTDITGGLGIDPDGSNTGSVTLSFDPTEFGTLSTLDGNEEMWGYSSIVGQPVKYDIQGVFSNVLTSGDGSITITESGANQIDIRAVVGGGGTDDQTIDVFSFSSPTLSLSLENDGEATKTVNLSSLLDNTDSQTLSLLSNTLSITGGNSVDLSAYDMNNFNIQADGGASTSITDNETINFDAGANMTISRTGNTLLFESTGGGSGVSSITGGTGLNPDAASTGAVTMDLDFSELTLSSGYDYNDFLVGTTSAGTESRTNVLDMFDNTITAGSGISVTNTGTSLQIAATGAGSQLTQEEVQDYVGTMVSGNTEVGISVTYDDINNEFDFVATDASTTNELQDFDIAQLSGTDLQLSLTQDATTHTIDLSSLGGGSGMTSWTARGDDGGTFAVNDSYVLDFDGLAGIETTSTSGDINIGLDGDEFIDGGGSSDGSYYMWVWKGVITYRETIQNMLNSVLSAGTGITISNAGSSVSISNKQESGLQTGTTNASGQFTISHSLGASVIPMITGRNGLVYSVTGLTPTTVTVTMSAVISGALTPAASSPYNVFYLFTAP